MQHGFPEPAKSARATRPEADEGVAANGAAAAIAEIVGERKRVLDLGCGNGELARLLARNECDIVGIDINPAAVEEARAYCTRALVADIDGGSVSELAGDQPFDVIVLSDVLQYLRQPTRLLDSARDVLRDGGCVVALIPNVSHGAIRLALLDGQFDRQDESNEEAGLRHFTAKTIDELFVSAGYRIDSLQRTIRPIFDGDDSVPHVEREDFDPTLVAEIERDPEATTLQFVVRALPLTNDAKHRAIAKRFLSANTELSATLARLEKRDREIERLAAQTAAIQADLASTRERLADAGQRPSIEAAQDLAVDGRVLGLIERAHRAEIEAVRLEERLSTGADLRTQLMQAIEARETLRIQLTSSTEELGRFRAALTAERVNAATAATNAAAAASNAATEKAEIEGRLARIAQERAADHTALQSALIAKDDEIATLLARVTQLEAEIVSYQGRLNRAIDDLKVMQAELTQARTELGQAATLAAETTALLSIADAEIAALERRAGAVQNRPDETGLAQTYDDAILRAELATSRRSAAILADQLYDEIRLLYESRAAAHAEALEARSFLERDTQALGQEIERLEDEARSLRLKLLNTSRAHDRLEVEARDQVEAANATIVAIETQTRVEIEAANATIAAIRTQTRAEIEAANQALARVKGERDAERAARVAGDEQHDRLREALVDARGEVEAVKGALEGAEERLKVLERRFTEQTRALLDQTRGEAARVAILIDTVQSSFFWKLKRVFARLRER